MRGGNGYIEEWVNARLVRDSYLGAIWEGATPVVALDVQRAIMRERCHEAFLTYIGARLQHVAEPAAKPWVDVVVQAVEALRRRIDVWPALTREDLELEAKPAADLLYHLLAASLLLGEGQALRERSQDFRKLLVGALYVQRWLTPRDPRPTLRRARPGVWLDALIAWTPVPKSALARLVVYTAGGRGATFAVPHCSAGRAPQPRPAINLASPLGDPASEYLASPARWCGPLKCGSLCYPLRYICESGGNWQTRWT